MKKIILNIGLFIAIILCGFHAKASHILGGQITYRCLQSTYFEISLDLYRDCNGIALPTSLFLSYQDSCISQSLTLQQFSITDVSPVFWSNQSSCNGGTGIGVEKVTYRGYITFLPSCGPINLFYSTCCRSNAITNLNNGGNTSFYLESTIEDPQLCNSSPTFNNTPIIMGCVNQQLSYNMMSSDLDGDSLHFSLIDCQQNDSMNVTYNALYSGTAFLGSGSPVTIDPNTGQITVTPTQLEMAVVCVAIDEYRNGNYIGTVQRELQCVIIQDCSLISNSIISGNVLNDTNSDCIVDTFDFGLNGWHVLLIPGGYVATTDPNGNYNFYGVPIGSYQLELIHDSTLWSIICPNSNSYAPVVLTTNDTITQNDFYVTADIQCSDLYVDVTVIRARPCFNNNFVYVQYCNDNHSTVGQDSVYVQVSLDNDFTVVNSSMVPSNINGNDYEFYVGYLAPGQCGTITLQCSVSCSTLIGETVCVEANILPVDTCIYRNDTLANNNCGVWDRSSLLVEGYCLNDSLVCFNVINTGDPGNGDMQCFQEIRVYIDSALFLTDSVMINGGDTAIFCYLANGFTWRLEADQHPAHPGNSYPNDVVELCGDSLSVAQNWTSGVQNQFPVNDDDQNTDIDCVVTAASYDPNDKRGFPMGLTQQHIIRPNTDIEYIIRFQNTGTDTAFTVVIVDTLSDHLDLTSIRVGASSHDYSFEWLNANTIEWTFDNILLPDSNTNVDASQGFVSFKISQEKDLPLGTYIHNDAEIYFDFNAPIVTNQTTHLIGDPNYNWVITSVEPTYTNEDWVKVFPNPVSDVLHLFAVSPIQNIQLLSLNGQVLRTFNLNAKIFDIDLNDLANGIYFLQIQSLAGRQSKKIIKK